MIQTLNNAILDAPNVYAESVEGQLIESNMVQNMGFPKTPDADG